MLHLRGGDDNALSVSLSVSVPDFLSPPSLSVTHLLSQSVSLLRGQRALYLAKERQTETQTETESVSLIPVTILDVHIEQGAEFPFFTIQLTDEDSGHTREKQTEWHRYVCTRFAWYLDLFTHTHTHTRTNKQNKTKIQIYIYIIENNMLRINK